MKYTYQSVFEDKLRQLPGVAHFEVDPTVISMVKKNSRTYETKTCQPCEKDAISPVDLPAQS